MATKDYTKTLVTVRRLIEKTGATVTLVALGTTPPDPAKPWNTPARGTPGAEVVATAVRVPPSGLQSLGLDVDLDGFAENLTAVWIIAPPEADPEGLAEGYSFIREGGGTEYKIQFMTALKPATVTVLYFAGGSS